MKRYILIVLLVFSVHFAVPTLYQSLGIGEILRENFRYGDIIFENNPISFQFLIITIDTTIITVATTINSISNISSFLSD